MLAQQAYLQSDTCVHVLTDVSVPVLMCMLLAAGRLEAPDKRRSSI